MLSLNYWEKAAAFTDIHAQGLRSASRQWRARLLNWDLMILSCQPSMRSWYA